MKAMKKRGCKQTVTRGTKEKNNRIVELTFAGRGRFVVDYEFRQK